jgi:plastocyanin
MRLKAALAATSLAAVLALAACGGGSDDSSSTAPTDTATATEPSGTAESTESEPAPSGEAARAEKVEIVDFAYDPDPVVVQVGGKVTWINQDSAPHTATADDGSFDTGDLEQGKLKSETFKQPGTFTYFCEVHPYMHGSVEVVAKD